MASTMHIPQYNARYARGALIGSIIFHLHHQTLNSSGGITWFAITSFPMDSVSLLRCSEKLQLHHLLVFACQETIAGCLSPTG